MDNLVEAALERIREDGHKEADAGDPDGRRRQLALDLLQCYFAKVVDIQSWQGRFTTKVGPKPKASPLVRYQSEKGNAVINFRHERVGLDALCQKLVRYLDGASDREGHLDALCRSVESGELKLDRNGSPVTDKVKVRAILDQNLDAVLGRIAAAAVLEEASEAGVPG